MQNTQWLCMKSIDCMTYPVIIVIKMGNNKLCERLWTRFLWWVPATAVENALFS